MKKEILVLDFDTQETVSIIVDSEPESIEETIEEYGMNSNNCSWTIRDFLPKRKTLVYLHVKNNNKNRTTINPTFAETIIDCSECNGNGFITKHSYGGRYSEEINCQDCNGRGCA